MNAKIEAAIESAILDLRAAVAEDDSAMLHRACDVLRIIKEHDETEARAGELVDTIETATAVAVESRR